MSLRNPKVMLVVMLLIFVGCAPQKKRVRKVTVPEIYTFKYLDGSIESIKGDIVTIRFTLPEFDTSTLPFTNRVTQKLIIKSFLLENGETKIEDQKVKVMEIRDNLLTVRFEESPMLNVGSPVKIIIPKKVVALTDFEVIRGRDKTIGVVSMESLTTAMVSSGQFNIVERYKLKAILKELDIGLAGLTDSKKTRQFGDLFQADLILTGTLADLGGYWNVNVRLINVSTGLIVAAFEEKATFSDIKPSAFRDTSNLNETFEGKRKPGWIIFSGRRWGATSDIRIDKENGAAGTSSSIRTKFRLEKKPSFTRIVSLRNRDLSLYTGIEFYAKSDREINFVFSLRDENRDNHDLKDHWFTILQVGSKWEKYRINFYDLSLSQRHAKRLPGGDGILNSDLVSGFGFGVETAHNPVGTSGTLWIDQIRFY